MAQTIITLALPYTFCDEGNYIVNLDGKSVEIKAEYVQSVETLNRITGQVSGGRITLMADDPEGVARGSSRNKKIKIKWIVNIQCKK